MTTDACSFLPDRTYARELIRPWKLITFGIAMSWLLFGATFYGIGDWDIGVTFLMGGLTYLVAPWSIHAILCAIRYKSRLWYLHIITAIFAWLFVVDWAYMAYHTLVDNPIYRIANFYASTPIYFMAGIVWLYRGSTRDFLAELKKHRDQAD